MILCFSHSFQMHSTDSEIKISPGQQSSQDTFIHSLMLMNKLKSEMVRFYIEYRAQETYQKTLGKANSSQRQTDQTKNLNK